MPTTLEQIDQELSRRRQGEAPAGGGLAAVEGELERRREPEARSVLDNAVSVGRAFAAPVDRFAGGFNRSLSTLAGGPVDFVNSLLEDPPTAIPGIPSSLLGFDIGLDTAERPIGGSESIREAAGAVGINTESEGMLGRIGEEVGAAVGFAAPIARVAGQANRFTRPAQTVGQGVVNRLADVARRRPGAFLAGEVGTAVGSGAGASLAANNQLLNRLFEDLGASPEQAQQLSEMAGQVVGGVGTAAAADRGARLLDFALGIPLSQRQVTSEAARRVQGAALDPEGAAITINNTPETALGVPLTSAQRSGDLGLMALERQTARTSPEAVGTALQQRSTLNQAARQEIDSLAPAGSLVDTQDFLAGRVEQAEGIVRGRMRGALERAAQRIEGLDTTGDPAVLSRTVRDEIEGALGDARATERQLWQEVTRGGEVPIAPLREAASDITAGQSRVSDPANVPQDILSLIDEGFDETATAGELLELRSRVLQQIREAQAVDAPNRRLIGNLQRLQGAILDTLEAGGGDAASRARQFSREVNDIFSRGPVADILASNRRGGARVDPALTLSRLLRPGAQGGIGADALLSAMGGREAVVDATEQFLRRQFVDSVAPDGTVRSRDLQRFLSQNEDVLRRFPAVRDELQDVFSAQRLAERVSASGDRALQRISRSRARLFLGRDPAIALDEALQGREAPRRIAELIRTARQDETGLALQGLQRGFIDRLLRPGAGVVTNAQDEAGGAVISSAQLTRRLNDPAFLATARQLIGEEGVDRLRRVEDALRFVDRIEQTRLPGGSDTAQNLGGAVPTLARIGARLTGARVGAAMGRGGGSIQTANIMSRTAQNFINNILDLPQREVQAVVNEAILDPELMRALLLRPVAKNEESIVGTLQRKLPLLGIRLPVTSGQDAGETTGDQP